MVPADMEDLAFASDHLRAGESLVFPTDTVYGLGASCGIESAVLRLYRIKGRPLDKPIPILLADPDDVTSMAKGVSALAERLIARFFPGPLTLVLTKADSVPDWVTAGRDSIAVRVPDHPFARSLIRGLGSPLAATSANLAGQPAPVTAQEAKAQLGELVSLVLDGGPCPGGVESTVLDLTGPSPAVLRKGAIPLEALEEVCGRILNMLEWKAS
ncbi:MAG: L-threonylcarbamoyladenylate synthase [Dehalococcoidia bacterium]|nr:L-threonylcarbamoyladenylate synthase [Dehalococcoidia bacterium]